MESLKAKGCEMLEDKKVTDFNFDEETGCVTAVVCGNETYSVDAVVMAVGITTLQETIKKRFALLYFPYIGFICCLIYAISSIHVV